MPQPDLLPQCTEEGQAVVYYAIRCNAIAYILRKVDLWAASAPQLRDVCSILLHYCNSRRPAPAADLLHFCPFSALQGGETVWSVGNCG